MMVASIKARNFSLFSETPIQRNKHPKIPTSQFHMTKMAAMSIYGNKPLKLFFSRTKSPMILKLGMYHWGLKRYKVHINDDPGLSLTYLRQGQIGSPVRLNGENCYKVIQWRKSCSKGLY